MDKTVFYELLNKHDQVIGIFTTPEKAMTYVYLSQIYQWWRGYSRTLHKYIWLDDSGLHWYAHLEEDAFKEPKDRGRAQLEIHILTVDRMPPCDNELWEYATEQRLPTEADLTVVKSYWDKQVQS